jgi:hypothetical protein
VYLFSTRIVGIVLTIYRRHSRANCRYKSRRYTKFRCPIWVQGSLGGEYVKQSLNLTSWEAASARVTAWNARGEVGAKEVPSIEGAVTRYLDDARARHLRLATPEKLTRIFEKDSWASLATRASGT